MEIPLIALLALIFELVTLLTRLIFGSGKKFWEDRKIPNIHLFYFGVIFFVLSFFYQKYYFLETGIALMIQDIFHHLIILPLWISDAELP